MLGKIVARTGHSFNRRKPRIELTSKTTVSPSRKTAPKRKSSQGSEKSLSKIRSKSQGKRAHSVRRSRLKNAKRKPRAKHSASRNNPSDRE